MTVSELIKKFDRMFDASVLGNYSINFYEGDIPKIIGMSLEKIRLCGLSDRTVSRWMLSMSNINIYLSL